ncbi:MAG: trypsin-like peptidase domain-containing protein [Planctomycetota bacterium]|jgi:S1-C subfamily serine protease
MSSAPEEAVWRLRPLGQPELAPSISVPETGLTIGRSPENVLPLDAEQNPGVSGLHCKLIVEGDDLSIEDLGSKNGTIVDGVSVEKRELRNGAIITLGNGGPRFAVLAPGQQDETLMMKLPPTKKRRFGSDTMEIMREELGISDSGGVDEMLSTQRRRTHKVVYGMGASLVVLLSVTIWALSQLGGESLAEMRETLRNEIAAERQVWQDEKDKLEQAIDDRRAQLEADRTRLQASIDELRQGDLEAAGTLDQLQKELADTHDALERFNPVNLEKSRLSEVQSVEDAVVLVEVRKTYRNEESGRLLHLNEAASGRLMPNLDDEGEVFVRESTGSGFCLTAEGWILTNAHVALKKGKEDSLIDGPMDLSAEVGLEVVFSGTEQRYPATLVDWRAEGNDDLALLKIEPFEGMPHIDTLDLTSPRPAEGTEVFLIGFPLGKQAMQQGDKMIASTFRGIVSRHLEDYVQVDAAVHPGASGGPVIDGQGNVLGVVVGMQNDERGGSSAMGFLIPIARAGKIWPPKN